MIIFIFQLVRVAIVCDRTLRLLRDAGQYKINGLVGALDDLGERQALAQEVVLRFAQRTLMQLRYDDGIRRNDCHDDSYSADD